MCTPGMGARARRSPESSLSTVKGTFIMSGMSCVALARPFWLHTPCPPWCDGIHEDSDLVVDRRHRSSWGKRITLSTMEPTRVEVGVVDDRVRYEPCLLDVRLDQAYREIEPRVRIEEIHHRGRFILTLTEAERLSKALTQAVARARGD